MASSNTTTTFGSDPTIPPNTTFVQADPSNFRAVVQKLTGASQDPSVHKLPLTLPSRLAAGDIGPKRPNFKLHERRLASAKKMELSIGVSERPMTATMFLGPGPGPSPSPGRNRGGFMGFGMGSPVSPLEIMLAREEKEEERVILEKGFYFLHPSPLSTTDPPQLLPLFPLHSPTSNNNQQQPNSSSS